MINKTFNFSGAGLPENKKVGSTVGLIDLYPTLIDLCDLPEQHKMDGESLLPALTQPGSVEDRNLFIPYHERGSYAVVNSKHRYIYYKEGTEEFYNLEVDPNEWNNVADNEEYRTVIEDMKKAVPSEFSVEATPKNKLRLVIEGDSFHWEHNEGGFPVGVKKKN